MKREQWIKAKAKSMKIPRAAKMVASDLTDVIDELKQISLPERSGRYGLSAINKARRLSDKVAKIAREKGHTRGQRLQFVKVLRILARLGDNMANTPGAIPGQADAIVRILEQARSTRLRGDARF